MMDAPAKPECREELKPERGEGRGRFWIALGIIVLAGACVRFTSLTARELWFDENCTFYASHHLADWPADGPEALRELGHIPYFAALHLWTKVAGETAFGVRSFSAFFGCLGVLAVGCVGASIGGRRVGLAAAILAAVSPLHVYYSQEARVYTMWAFEAALALYAMHRAASSLSTRWWIAYAAIVWAMVATHYYTILWIPASVTAVLVAPCRVRFIRGWLITHAFLALAIAPVAWFIIVPFAEGGPKLWLREIWLGYPPVLAVLRSLWALLPAGGYPGYLGSLAAAESAIAQRGGEMVAHLVVFGPAAYLAVVGSTFAWTRLRFSRTPICDSDTQVDAVGRTASVSSRAVGFLFAHTVVFLTTAFCYSWLMGPSYVVGRYDLIAWPAVTIAIAALVNLDGRSLGSQQRRQPNVGRWVGLALLVACSGVTLVAARSVPVNNRLAQRARHIALFVGADDLVVSVAMYRWFMVYEWQRIGFDPEVISFPPAHDRQLCWDNPEAELKDSEKLAADVLETIDQIEHALDSGRRVWLLAHGEPTGQRWQVDQHFFTALRDAKLEIHLTDETAGLAELKRSTDRPID